MLFIMDGKASKGIIRSEKINKADEPITEANNAVVSEAKNAPITRPALAKVIAAIKETIIVEGSTTKRSMPK